MNFKPFLVTILTLQMFISKSFGIFLPELFRGWISHTEEGCDGVCQLSLTCWFSGGRTSLDGDCNSMFKVCCDHSRQSLAEARKIDTWDDVIITNSIEEEEEPQDIHYGNVINEPNCGRSTIARRRVVGGSEAGFGVYPWQALIQVGTSRCGGALIGRQHVITAGHCVHSMAKKFGEFPPIGIRVYLGEYSLYSEIEPLPRQVFSVSRIYLHPYYEFTPQADRFDVAVLKLSRPVLYEAHISPICLPQKGEDLNEGAEVMVSGWGATESDSIKRPKELQVVDVKIVTPEKCEKWHQGNDIEIKIFDDMLCAGHEEGGKDACQGDSGGPLMHKDHVSGHWTLVGVVSAGYSCAKPGQPGIYHKVSKTSDWVSYIVRQSKLFY